MEAPMFNVKATLTPEGRLTMVTDQYNRALILQTNHELQKCEPMQDREGLGRWALSIPFVDWLELRRKYPKLASRDVREKSRAYLQFMQSPESIPYRVRERV